MPELSFANILIGLGIVAVVVFLIALVLKK